MMIHRMLLRSIRILLPAALLPALAAAQATLGATLTQVVKSGEGVARSCSQGEYGTALGARLSVPVLSRQTSVQVAGRGYWVNRGAECDHLAAIPPPDGTYVDEDRINLLSRSFITTDVRLATWLGETPTVSLAAGVGNAWHEGHDLPYLVLAAGLALLDQPEVRLELGGEYQWLRVTSDRFRRTILQGELVAEEPLGRHHEWSHALVFGLSADFVLSGQFR